MGKHALQNVDGFVKREGELFMFDPREIVRIEDKNIRRSYGRDEEDVALLEFIRTNGMQSVPPLDVQKQSDNTLLLRDGFRRHWAAMHLINDGVDVRSCFMRLVSKDMTDDDAIYHALSSGQGKNPSPFEEGDAFFRLKNNGHDVKSIASRIGRSVQYVYDRLRLVGASSEVRDAVEKGEVGISTASKVVAGAAGDSAAQKSAIQKTIERKNKIRVKWSKKEGLFIAKGESDKQQSEFIGQIFGSDFADQLTELGLDYETVTFSVARS